MLSDFYSGSRVTNRVQSRYSWRRLAFRFSQKRLENEIQKLSNERDLAGIEFTTLFLSLISKTNAVISRKMPPPIPMIKYDFQLFKTFFYRQLMIIVETLDS